jgi:hypothetical protein
MMPDTGEMLVAHDWHTIACQCDHYDCTRKGGCQNQATRHIEFHALDQCNTPVTRDGDTVNPFGNYVYILCEPCLNSLAQAVAVYVDRLNVYGRKTCMTCGAPIRELSDIIREVTPL